MLTERTLSMWMLAAAALAAAVGVVVFRFVDPNDPHSLLPPCLFQAATGFFCAGCGITRALHALAHGDLVRALEMNPLAVAMTAIGPLMLLRTAGWKPAALNPLMRVVLSGKFWLILLPAYWIARNLPWWPFAWLAPG
jgi:hypothetical protein